MECPMKTNGKYILLNLCWLLAIAEVLAQCLLPHNTRLDETQPTPSDTVVYKYESPCSKGDTAIGNYKVSCSIRPNGEYTAAQYYGGPIAYVNENTELLMDVQYKHRGILSTVITREAFKEQMGITPHAYITNLKIDTAKILLKNPENSVTDVAMQLNFSSGNHFSAVFKRYTGRTPSQYRCRE